MNWKRDLIIILLGVLLLALGGTHGLALREIRHTAAPVSSPALREAPPAMVFTTIVLGGLRGIIADVLWLRASLLQDEGRYFEIVQLSDWITRLEPHFSDVWAYHAWNMAYNISVMMPHEEDRWRWVRNGIGLLRDEGIEMNPSDPKLFFELGWMFQHKIGSNTDKMHTYFKAKWTEEMEALLGSGHPDLDKLSPEALLKLKNEYKMDPGLMRQIDKDYGPLDWRLPQAHAIYWGIRGRQAAKTISPQCERLIYQSLANPTLNGTIREAGPGKPPVYEPDFKLVPKTIKAFNSLNQLYPSDSIRTAYSFFLKDVVLAFHKYGRDDEGREILKLIAQEFPDENNAGNYDAFIQSHIRKQ